MKKRKLFTFHIECEWARNGKSLHHHHHHHDQQQHCWKVKKRCKKKRDLKQINNFSNLIRCSTMDWMRVRQRDEQQNKNWYEDFNLDFDWCLHFCQLILWLVYMHESKRLRNKSSSLQIPNPIYQLNRMVRFYYQHNSRIWIIIIITTDPKMCICIHEFISKKDKSSLVELLNWMELALVWHQIVQFINHMVKNGAHDFLMTDKGGDRPIK